MGVSGDEADCWLLLLAAVRGATSIIARRKIFLAAFNMLLAGCL
jgi:hypothetical protein